MRFTISDCKAAQRACEKLAEQAGSKALEFYWLDVANMWRRREREIERASLARMRCAKSIPLGNDERSCPECFMVWARDEERPPCPKLKDL